MKRKRTMQIGRHISISPDIYRALDAVKEENCAFQIFISSNLNPTVKINDETVARISQLIEANNMCIFIHAPYTLNPCNPKGAYFRTALSRQLEYGNAMGMKGLVIHVGKPGKGSDKDVNEAKDDMYKEIVQLAKLATSQCPLILETPAGQGSELLTSYEEFRDFLLRYYREFRATKYESHLKVCVDSCHIFASGYQPYKYITDLIRELPDGAIVLIHYNGSKGELGCKKDRHALFNSPENKISDTEMRKIALLNIPKIIE